MENQISPVLLAVARQRVARGMKWLDRRSKFDSRFKNWRLSLIWITDGHVQSLVKNCYSTNGPLSLILRWESDLASEIEGRVTWATVASEFKFEGKKALCLGFDDGYFKDSWYEYRDELAYSYALDKAWEEALRNFTEPDAPRLYRDVTKQLKPAKIPVVRQIKEMLDIFFGR